MLWKQVSYLCVLLVPTTGARILQVADEERVRTDLVRLSPFDLQIAMAGPTDGVNIYALSDIVTDWMHASFERKSQSQGLLGNMTTFDSIALEWTSNNRKLQQEDIGLYSASFEGVSLWNRKGLATPPTDHELVELIQRATFLEDNQLLTMLQNAQDFSGLGDDVIDVRAFIVMPTSNTSSSNDNNLEIIIIIAIVVACLAFGLLIFAVVWAWRTDQNRRGDAFKTASVVQRPTDGTGSESDEYEKQRQLSSPTKQRHHQAVPSYHHASSPPAHPPMEIEPEEYPESVLSEDISSSLTAFYRSGMAGYSLNNKRELNDAASMSSMDSYGYSLDGYAPSLTGGPAPAGYPVGPLTGGSTPFNGQIKDPGEVDDKEDS